MLVVVCGVPGVGKSTVANQVTDRLDATLLRTDVVRRDVVDDPEYTDAERRRVYGELFARAFDRLVAGETVVLDATFQNRVYRRHARRVAEAAGVPFRLVEVVCDDAVADRRIETRTDGPSDADLAVRYVITAAFEPIELPHETVDNSGSLAATREQVAELFARNDDPTA
jgi:hypothetical protein